MSNYLGVKCPVCNKKFTQTDDIVVCPVCGAPHHRACYAEKGECEFVSEHINGKDWVSPTAVYGNDKPSEVKTCPACDSANPTEAVFCQICGKHLSDAPTAAQNWPGPLGWGFPGFGAEADPAAQMYGGVSPDDVIDGESARDMAVYIGESSAYYLPKFKAMFEASRTLSFNFSALIFSFFYFFYRKMYVVGAVLTALFAICLIPSMLEAREALPLVFLNLKDKGMLPPPLASINYESIAVDYARIDHYRSLVNLSSTINFMISMIASLCANRLYQIQVTSGVKKIRESRGEPADERAYNDSLASKGGTDKIAVFIAVGVIAVAYIAVCALIAFEFMGGVGL